MAKHPWFKFFPGDWRANSALTVCSPVARLLWFEMLCVMHNAEPRGHLLVNGKVPTEAQLAALCRMTKAQVRSGLKELEEMTVFSKTDEGVIFSRKMVRDGGGDASDKWVGTEGPKGRDLRSQRLSEARKKARHTPEEWDFLLTFCGRKCVKCGSKDRICKDHITPIYQGGSDGIANLQPLCFPCNSSKGPEAVDYRPEGWKEALENASTQAFSDASYMLETRDQKNTPPTPPTKSDGGSAAPDGAGGGDSGPSKSVDMPKWMEPYFEKWWSAYPLKKRKLQARPVFRRAWAKIEPAVGMEGPEGRMSTLMAGTAAYVAEIAAKGTTPDKIAHPTTWLNGGGWADEYQALAKTKPAEKRGALY